jgi:hypothetical protein
MDKLKVLVVDDELQTVKTICDILKVSLKKLRALPGEPFDDRQSGG